MSDKLPESIDLGSSCPLCGARPCWFEMGPPDNGKYGYRSLRLNCERCGCRVKQDVPDGDDPTLHPIGRPEPC